MRRLDPALAIQQELRDPRFASQALEVAAWIAILRQQPQRAARILGAVSALRETIGVQVPPMTQVYYDEYVSHARAQLSPTAWDDAWEAGRELSLEAAIELARRDETAREPVFATAASSGLTAREIEVLHQLVQGKTNQEIAVALSISPHTAANHVTNIMNKLNVESRTAAATWAVRSGI
jgi:non-specific serine/threonine protein kinase